MYCNVSSQGLKELDTRVQEKMDDGWSLHGMPYTAGPEVVQCMVCDKNSQGVTVDDIATLSLLKRINYLPYR
jgi:hypothetical protein